MDEGRAGASIGRIVIEFGSFSQSGEITKSILKNKGLLSYSIEIWAKSVVHFLSRGTSIGRVECCPQSNIFIVLGCRPADIRSPSPSFEARCF